MEDLFSIAQTTYNEGGRMPIDTGNLRNDSFIAAINGTTAMTGEDAYRFAIGSLNVGDVFFGGWRAEYARRMEYGFIGTDSMGRNYNQQGFGFVAHAAAQWQDLVDKNAMRLRGMSG